MSFSHFPAGGIDLFQDTSNTVRVSPITMSKSRDTRQGVCRNSMASNVFAGFKAPAIQYFLKLEGISASRMKRQHLRKVCEALKTFNLSYDQDI